MRSLGQVLVFFNRDFPDATSYWPQTVALSAVEDDYGLDREIAWRSPGVVGLIGRLDGSCSDRYGALRAHFDTRPPEVLRVGGSRIERFEDIQRIVRMAPEQPLEIVVLRDDAEVTLTATPRLEVFTDTLGNEQKFGLLGIQGGATQYVKRGPLGAVWWATKETFELTIATLKAVGQMIAGSRSAEDLGGPLMIAQLSGQVAEIGIVSVIRFMVLLSVNLGLINLFPIPMLDGGHLLFYAIEAVRGRPLGERTQEYGFRLGLALVLCLMIFVTWNDLMRFDLF